MAGPGEYVPDVTEGITRVEDLPKAKIKRCSRKYKRRPCPYCGHSSYRDKVFTRKLHDLGDLAANRPIDLWVTYSQHCCSKCRKYFNADMYDLADPPCCSFGSSSGCGGRLTISAGIMASMAGPSGFCPVGYDSELG